MKLIIYTTIMTLAAAQQRNYLPPHQSPGQSFQTSSSSGFVSGNSPSDTGNRRPQQDVEKNAAILKLEQEVNENGFHYSYETSNGIKAEESGNAQNSQGGFSYQGDDGNTYTVTFTAGEGGFVAQGAHLPVAPPTPDDILVALRQNAEDEANGIFDDGKYKPEVHGGNNGKGSQQGPGSGYSSGFGSGNRQGSFNSKSGYNY